jgi:hypothetical protein
LLVQKIRHYNGSKMDFPKVKYKINNRKTVPKTDRTTIPI